MFSRNVRKSPLDATPITSLLLVEESVISPLMENHALQFTKRLIHLFPTSDPLSLRAVVIIV